MNRRDDISSLDPGSALPDTAWVDVLKAVDKTYSELVAYQE